MKMKHPIPTTSLPWESYKKLQKKKLLSFAGVFILIGAIGFSGNIMKYLNKNENITIVFSATALTAPIKITDEMVVEKTVPKFLAPNDVLLKKELIGVTLLQNISENTIIRKSDIHKSINPESMQTKISEEKNAITLPESWFETPINTLVPGDAVDIWSPVAMARGREMKKIVIGLEIIELQNEAQKKLITISASEDQIRNILAARTSGAPMFLSMQSLNQQYE